MRCSNSSTVRGARDHVGKPIVPTGLSKNYLKPGKSQAEYSQSKLKIAVADHFSAVIAKQRLGHTAVRENPYTCQKRRCSRNRPPCKTIEYTKQRKAFGQQIGSFQYNKFLLAELVTTIDVTQSFVDSAVQAHSARKLTAVDAAKAKWWSAEVQNKILDACVQLHGGYGFMNEYRVAQAWKDARVTKIWAGSNEIMKEIIGRDLGL